MSLPSETSDANRSPSLRGPVSGLLGSRLAATGDNSAELQALEGVVLFVDIVSSTSMTDRMAATGPDGAELLGGFLNAYFARLIDIVVAHGGDVVRIDGDAIIALWPKESGRAHVQAAKAALDAREVRPVWPVQPPEQLRHRIALVEGRFVIAVLTGVERRRFLLFAGEPLQAVGQIIRCGSPGDVILDEGVARLLAPLGSVVPVASADPTLPAATRLDHLRDEPGHAAAATDTARPAAADDPESGCVPLPAVEREAQGLSAWLAEFRILSVVFARIGDAALTGTDGLDQVQASFQAVAAAAAGLGVEPSDLLADEKGIIAVIACGLPPFGSEGNAVKAVEIARRIRDELCSRDAPCAVGVATGQVFCGDVGNVTRREFVLSGPAMNYGARLMQGAEQAVLCDAGTAQAASARFSFSPGDAMAVRGSSTARVVHRLIEPRPFGLPARYSTSLQGREAEFGSVLARIEQPAAGGILAIVAEPGAGKSRLLAELAAAARQRGCTVLEAATDGIEQTTSYFMFRPVLRQLLAQPGDESDLPLPRLRQRLEDALAGTGLLPRAALIEDVAPLGFDDPGLAAQIRGAARRDGVAEIVVALAGRRAAQGRLVLLVDDLQWIDALSANLLLAASAQLPMLVVAASRPASDFEIRSGQRVLDRAEFIIPLQRLPLPAMTRMIGELLEVPAVPRRLAAFVHEQSAGLPIHAEQLVFAMREQGVVEVRDGKASVTAPDLATASIPLKLREIILSRIDRLSQTDQLAGKVASAIGRVFEFPTLCAAYPGPTGAGELERSVDMLSASKIVAPDGEAYAFRHVIIQQTVYDLLSYAQRRILHRAIAEAIEARYQGALRPHFVELAHHWEHGDCAEKALSYRLLAADLALRRYANDDALMHADRAIRLAERSQTGLTASQSAQLAAVRGEAYHAMSRFAEAEQQFIASLRLNGIRPPATRMRLVLSIATQLGLQLLHRFGIVPRPRSEGGEARAKLSAHLHTRFAEHAYFMRDSLAIMHGSLTALNRAESVNSYPEMTEAYGALAIGLGTVGLHPVARFYRDRSIAVAGRFGGVPDQAFARYLAGVYELATGQWAATRRNCAESVGLSERLGDHFRRQSCRVVECFAAIGAGDYASAEAGLREFGPEAELIDNPPVRAWALAAWGLLDMLRGASPEPTLARFALLHDAALHRGEQLLCDGIEAAALMQAGRASAAAKVAARALDDMEESVCTVAGAMHSVAAVAEVMLALADGPGSLDPARAGCGALRRFASKTRIGRPRAHLLTGRLLLREGRREMARRRFLRALGEAERLGMPLEEALAHRELGALPGADPSGVHAATGERILHELGAAPWRLTPARDVGCC